MFGEIVRAHRRRLGLTQEELAEQAGLSVRCIRKIEARQIGSPRAVTVRLLAGAMDLSGSDLDRFRQAAAVLVPRSATASAPPPAQTVVTAQTACVGEIAFRLRWAHGAVPGCHGGGCTSTSGSVRSVPA